MKRKTTTRFDYDLETDESTSCEPNMAEYDACPVCKSEEFMLSESGELLLCINCGPVYLVNYPVIPSHPFTSIESASFTLQ